MATGRHFLDVRSATMSCAGPNRDTLLRMLNMGTLERITHTLAEIAQHRPSETPFQVYFDKHLVAFGMCAGSLAYLAVVLRSDLGRQGVACVH